MLFLLSKYTHKSYSTDLFRSDDEATILYVFLILHLFVLIGNSFDFSLFVYTFHLSTLHLLTQIYPKYFCSMNFIALVTSFTSSKFSPPLSLLELFSEPPPLFLLTTGYDCMLHHLNRFPFSFKKAY